MRADEIHRVQDLNVRDTTDGSPERIHDDLRTAEVDETAVARIKEQHLVFRNVRRDQHRHTMQPEGVTDEVQDQLT